MANPLRGELTLAGDEQTWRFAVRTQECLLAERLYREATGASLSLLDIIRAAGSGRVHAIVALTVAGLSGFRRLSGANVGAVTEEEALACIDDCGPARVAKALLDVVNQTWPKGPEDASEPAGKG